MGIRKKAKKPHIFVADFETTVDEDTTAQLATDVWAACAIPVYDKEETFITNNLTDFMKYMESLANKYCEISVYFHNLKFDGSFILSWCFRHGYVNAIHEQEKTFTMVPAEMPLKSVGYLITDMNVWYQLTVKFPGGNTVKFMDSLKLLPFSVKRIGEAFTETKKLEIEYKGKRYSGWNLSEEEKQYIIHDCKVIVEALQFMFGEGHKSMTIGSCCLSEYKRSLSSGFRLKTESARKKMAKKIFDDWFPDLTEIPLDRNVYGSDNADEYIRRSYKGGWCYLKPDYANVKITGGFTADVNSLYPSVMSGESGNRYPKGKPCFWTGNYIPVEKMDKNAFWFVRFTCRFRLKERYLPCVQIKTDVKYNPEEWLTTSDVRGKDGSFSRWWTDGTAVYDSCVEFTMTCTDFTLFKKHYEIFDLVILDGCWFASQTGMFDTYIQKYKEIKMREKGARRELAKLFLNNLYGKFATSPDSCCKIAVLEKGVLKFPEKIEGVKKSGYIAVGSAVTSYARFFTVTAAQKNYDRFVYADTDSIHCLGNPDELCGCKVHDTAFCCWKLESQWKTALFVRQKTYAEEIVISDGKKLDSSFWNLKCAGMGRRAKELFLMSIDTGFDFTRIDTSKYSAEELKFLCKKRNIEDFATGLEVPGQLKARQIENGVLLREYTFKMTPKKQRQSETVKGLIE